MEDIALNRAFLLPKLFGACLFKFRKKEIRVDYILVAWALFLKVIFVGGISDFMFHRSFVVPNTNKLGGVVASYSFLLIYGGNSVVMMATIFQKRRLRRILKSYLRANAMFSRLGIHPHCRIRLRYDCTILVLFLLPVSLRLYITKGLDWSMVYNITSILHTTLSLFISVQPFIRLLDNLRARMGQIRDRLKPTIANVGRLEPTLVLFELLCSTCEELNAAFSLQLLSVLAISFIAIVARVYSGLMSTNNFYVAIIMSYTSAYYILWFSLISNVCEKTNKEAKDFRDRLYTLIVSERTGAIANNPKVQLHISSHRELTFTAAGFFTVDHTLIHSMIASGCTYLVFLIQFGQLSAQLKVKPHPKNSSNATIFQ